jgi:hypothetical protein
VATIASGSVLLGELSCTEGAILPFLIGVPYADYRYHTRRFSPAALPVK